MNAVDPMNGSVSKLMDDLSISTPNTCMCGDVWILLICDMHSSNLLNFIIFNLFFRI